MSNIISGIIAVSMALVFLIFYAVRLHSFVLWIIILANVGFLVYDLYTSIRDGEDHI